jgi:hypothetical protein
MAARSPYPLVVTNRAASVQRGFILLWMGTIVAVTLAAWRVRPPEPTRLWPWILLLFWAVGFFALRWSFSVEAARLTIAGPAQASLRRGPPLRRKTHRLARVTLSLVESEDSDGDSWFRLAVDAPGGPAIIAEGRRRSALVALSERIERAARAG